ncbi:aldo/keto reductase [Streptomyces sp. CAU 1734]|uniref:aldo/keto reductase n=1 Tax=Streptomyces sp. CAU 1734 TaxID=3140360 RepID=UPI003261386F
MGLALGTFEFGSALSARRVFELLDTFHDLGGRVLDTAPTYGPTASGPRAEQLIGRWLATTGARMYTVTKAGLAPARPGQADLRPEQLIRSAEQSAQRLGAPPAALVLHRDDPAVPVGEVADALQHLIDTGTIQAAGASNWTTARLHAWCTHSAGAGRTGPRITQPLWSLARRTAPCPEPWLTEADPEHLAFAEQYGLTVMPYRTLAAGYLADRHSGRHHAHHTTTYDTLGNAGRRVRLRAAARRLGISGTALALAYLRSATRAHVVPVIGPTSIRQLTSVMTDTGRAGRLSPDLCAHLAGNEA